MECQVRDITFHYEEVGAGRPVLLVHGWPLDHRSIAHHFEPVFAARAGWRRIYPDLPGFGQTRAADWITCQDQVLDLLIGFIDAVAPGERFVVAGHSYGGDLARGLAHQRGAQMDGLMLLVPGGLDKEDLPQPLVVHEDLGYLAALAPGEQDLRGPITVQSMALLNEMREHYAPAGAIADQALMRRFKQHMDFSFDPDALPSPFRAPALFLTGRQDSWCGYRGAFRILDNYPRATYAVLDRAAHALAMEQRTLFRNLVSEWLDRVEEYAPAA